MTTTHERAHNFCAGPCALPTEVIDEIAAELPDTNHSGMSLIEMSHRGEIYDSIHREALALLRELYEVPENFHVILTQGGATLQFAMVPMNVLGASGPASGQRAGYVNSGTWAKKAINDAASVADIYTAWSGEADGFDRMATVDQLDIHPNSRYLHITSNETIGGIRLPEFYDIDIPLVADMSSDYMSRPVPWERFDVVYGGAQKNLGPAGLAVSFVRDAVVQAAPKLPDYLSYAYHAKGDSLANTPPMFSIWAVGKMLKWMKANGGVAGMEQRAAERSSIIYDTIDSSGGFYRSPVAEAYRSHTNIVFRLENEDLEKDFLSRAEEHRLLNLKGHRSVGGIRASIYNGTPTESVTVLAQFMQSFAQGTL